MKNKNLIFSLIPALFFISTFCNNPDHEKISPQIFKKVLDNGLTVLVKPNNTIPDVAIQMWYEVGSKDEETNEKGLAHLLEHMVFKGTKEMLSESDIFMVAHKLSGDCNAFTSYDYTCYVFNLPSRHWQEALPILADCMSNCTFKQDLLNAEFKAVVQELKMYRDKYERILHEELISTIFSDHPYHYPVIGFKQDIWKINSKNLHKFYKKHYKPNNATLVIVGDVNNIDDVFKEVENNFKNIAKDPNYKHKKFYLNNDLISKNIILYRDVKKPKVIVAYLIPGSGKIDFPLEVIAKVLSGDSSARLHQKIVEELKLANKIGNYPRILSDHGIFIFEFEPKEIKNIEKIIEIIKNEINDLIQNGITDHEIKKVINNNKLEYYDLMESNAYQAQVIGSTYLATKNENYIFDYFKYDISNIQKDVKEILTKYFNPGQMHKGYLLPANEQEKIQLKELQEKNDAEDTKFLDGRIRETEVEECKYANKINPKPINKFNFPKPKIFTLKNGIKVLSYENKNIPTISLILEPKVDHMHDSEKLPGLYSFTFDVAKKGTLKHSFKELSDELHSRAIKLSFNGSASLNLLNTELESGLKILTEIITEPKFDEHEIEKVREIKLSQIQSFRDNPQAIANLLVRENIYKKHPYGKNFLGTQESIEAITKDDIVNFYKNYFTPKGSTLSIVGDFANLNIQEILENTIGQWQGPEVPELNYPKIQTVENKEIKHFINRDQVVLQFAGSSVDRKNPDYEKLKIFDEIFSNGGSSRLFALREKTGFFYTIHGSTITYADDQPGIVNIFAMVSSNKLKQAEELILKTINETVDSITEEEVKNAKNALIDSVVHNYATNSAISSTMLYLETHDLPQDYYDNIASTLNKITFEDVKIAAKKVMNAENMIKVKVGRV